MVVVIDESIVKQLHIDEESWLEQIAISGGIFFETFVQEDTAGGFILGMTISQPKSNEEEISLPPSKNLTG